MIDLLEEMLILAKEYNQLDKDDCVLDEFNDNSDALDNIADELSDLQILLNEQINNL